MDEIIEVQGAYYVLARSHLADDSDRILKCGDTFGVFNRYGDIQPVGVGEEGLYHLDTRFLSRFELRLGKKQPLLLLSSRTSSDNSRLVVDLTNSDTFEEERLVIPRGTLHILREKILEDAICYERVIVSNFGLHPTEVSLSYHWKSDFRDIFEVRGVGRAERGEQSISHSATAQVSVQYIGLDDVKRTLRLSLDPDPEELAADHAQYFFRLAPQECARFNFVCTLVVNTKEPHQDTFERVAHRKVSESQQFAHSSVKLISSDEQLNRWMQRSLEDLRMLGTDTPEGNYPYAGIPWFNAVFGRDGLITGFQTLWFKPEVARGVLSVLSALQASEEDSTREAEPGKILHERRQGEMANCGEVPFERYYGSADATPLFVSLADAYYRRTADRDFLRVLWPSVCNALTWIQNYGDLDGDGFIEYQRRNEAGLRNQCWKDSDDSVSHSDGSLPQGPIAICEIQGYVYQAKKAAAHMARELGECERSEQLSREAEELRSRFDEVFWLEDLQIYALGLDGKKDRLRVKASNSGHLLFSGLPTRKRAEAIRNSLLKQDFQSGWGLRTLSSHAARYNPMSYHNGSVWPHDNAIIAQGFSNYGFTEAVVPIFRALYDVSRSVEDARLPELWCGFDRDQGEAPTLYPVACNPQAWSAGSVFLLLQAVLGIEIDGVRERITFRKPSLPDFIDQLQILGLQVGSSHIDLELQRHHGVDVTVTIIRRVGKVEIRTMK